ncbi:MAG: GIY-YIG nuclease family protein [Patescibacteria group bacterium]
MEWYVYIAKSKFGHYYTGISPNPDKRLILHNSGKGSQMAKDQGPFVLVYISQKFPNKSEARKREVQIKKWTREKKEKLIEGLWE